MASNNEMAYGPVADSIASKYNIPTEYFRSAIRQVSGFDPNYSSSIGKGIANLNTDIKGFDPMDVYSSLDLAAKSMVSSNVKNNDWAKSTSDFANEMDVTSKIKIAEIGNAAQAKADESGKYIWQYSIEDFKSLFNKSAGGLIIGVVGLILILGSVWVLVRSSSEK